MVSKSNIFSIVIVFSVFFLVACSGSKDDDEKDVPYANLDLSNAESLVLRRADSVQANMSSSSIQAASNDGIAETVLYKVDAEGKLNVVNFMDSEGNNTSVAYKPACAKNINDNYIVMFSYQKLPLKMKAINKDGTFKDKDEEVQNTSATLLIRKSDGKIFPFSPVVRRAINDDVLIESVCDIIVSSAENWTLPHNYLLITNLELETRLLINLSDNDSLIARKFILPGEQARSVIISPNAIGYSTGSSTLGGLRIIGDSYQASGRLINDSESKILGDGRSQYFALSDGKNYRRYLDRLFTLELEKPDGCDGGVNQINLENFYGEGYCENEGQIVQRYTGEINEVLSEITLTSDTQVLEQEVYRGSYTGSNWQNWGLVYRHPATDLFLGENCSWYDFNSSLPQKLAIIDSVIPSELISTYGLNNISCDAFISKAPFLGDSINPNYTNHEGYLSFRLEVGGNIYFAQYNPITKDKIVQQFPTLELDNYEIYDGGFFPISKGRFSLSDGRVFNSNGDQVFLYFDLETGSVTESIERRNDSGYLYISPLN